MVLMGILRLELDGRWKMKRRLSTSSQATASRRGVQRQIQGPACEAIERESETRILTSNDIYPLKSCSIVWLSTPEHSSHRGHDYLCHVHHGRAIVSMH